MNTSKWVGIEDSGLFNLREEGLLCDVVLRCTHDGLEVPAHKAVLAGHSSYFKALFCGNWDTGNGKSSVDITLDQVCGDALLCWIRAMYRSGFDRYFQLKVGLEQKRDIQSLDFTHILQRSHDPRILDVQKVKGVYQLCSFYDVPDILHWFERLVCHEVEQHTGVLPVVEISLLAMMGDTVDHIIDINKLVGCVAGDLARLLQSEHRTLLQQLTSGTLQMILRHDFNCTMRGRGTHNVEAIRIWLEGDPAARQAEMSGLLNSLPLSYSDLHRQLNEAIRTIEAQEGGDEEKIEDNPCRRALLDADDDVVEVMYERFKCQPSHDSLMGLLVFGGRLDVWIGVRECELYDARRDVWFLGPNLPSEALKVKGTSVTGGAFSLGTRAEVFDSGRSQWYMGPSDPTGGSSLLIDASSASIGSDVYVIGGQVGAGHTSYMSRYSLGTRSWTTLAGCHEDRQNQGFAALGGKLYCVGGQSKKVLTTVESYQPELDHWQTLHYAQLSSAVKYTSLAAHDGRLFRIGGRNSERRVLASVEAMDPREGFWTPIPPMMEARSSCGVASVGDGLYVCGGTSANNEDLLTSMECFSSTAGKWLARAPMSTQRTCHSLAAVCVCACVQDYSLSSSVVH